MIKNMAKVNEELTLDDWKKRYEGEKEKVSKLQAQLEKLKLELSCRSGDESLSSDSVSTRASLGYFSDKSIQFSPILKLDFSVDEDESFYLPPPEYDDEEINPQSHSEEEKSGSVQPYSFGANHHLYPGKFLQKLQKPPRINQRKIGFRNCNCLSLGATVRLPYLQERVIYRPFPLEFVKLTLGVTDVYNSKIILTVLGEDFPGAFKAGGVKADCVPWSDCSLNLNRDYELFWQSRFTVTELLSNLNSQLNVPLIKINCEDLMYLFLNLSDNYFPISNLQQPPHTEQESYSRSVVVPKTLVPLDVNTNQRCEGEIASFFEMESEFTLPRSLINDVTLDHLTGRKSAILSVEESTTVDLLKRDSFISYNAFFSSLTERDSSSPIKTSAPATKRPIVSFRRKVKFEEEPCKSEMRICSGNKRKSKMLISNLCCDEVEFNIKHCKNILERIKRELEELRKRRDKEYLLLGLDERRDKAMISYQADKINIL